MSDAKTKPTIQTAADLIAAVPDPARRAEATALDSLFRRVTGWEPVVWGAGLIGYGRYDYTYDSGRSGTFLATGFAARKAELSIYILPGYTDFGAILARLGKHKIGKSCLYLKRLTDVNQTVLAELIRAGLDDLATKHPLHSA